MCSSNKNLMSCQLHRVKSGSSQEWIGTRGHIALGTLVMCPSVCYHLRNEWEQRTCALCLTVMYCSVCYHLRNGLDQEDMCTVSHSNVLSYVLSSQEWVGTRGRALCLTVMYCSMRCHLRSGLDQEDMCTVSHSNVLFYALSPQLWVGMRGHVHRVSQ